MMGNVYLRLIMMYLIICKYFWRSLRIWRTLVLDYGLGFVMDPLTTISREAVSGLAECGSAWEDLITMSLESDLIWLPTLKKEASSGTIVRENLFYYFEEFCQEDVVPCKAIHFQGFLISWKMEVIIEWQDRSKNGRITQTKRLISVLIMFPVVPVIGKERYRLVRIGV
jgi:hypothetical protein